ncbi:MAG: 30S ribosomal protein S3 [Verrucomicrobia bacterium]|nr:30S ribosomal protein S3 [Verrucomicrobiota bacterium]MBU1909792.1 30S ribosomal protein S3 [Verrucomicrobiota bacterium]
MGQKVNPIGFRLCVNKDWRSRWYAEKRQFGDLLHEDLLIRELVKKKLKDAAVPEVLIERYANRARITIYTARPGIVIGRKGEAIEQVRAAIADLTKKEIYVEIREVKSPDTNAQLVAENIGLQLERRVSFRRALKRAVQMAMELGVLGIKVHVSGRLGGSELARREWYKEGKVPLHTLRANIQYGFTEAHTLTGKIGVKVWICKKEEDDSLKEKTHAAYA